LIRSLIKRKYPSRSSVFLNTADNISPVASSIADRRVIFKEYPWDLRILFTDKTEIFIQF